MVRISSDKKARRHRLIRSQFDVSSSLLNRQLFALFLLGVIALFVALYIFVLSKENLDADEEGTTTMLKTTIPIMASAHSHLSASRILSSKRPFLLYGTAWKEEETASYVNQAVHAGFRFVDTACQPKHYNEKGVGEGWSRAAQELGLDRSDFYLQTKFTSYSGQDPNRVPYDEDATLPEQVQQSLSVSLQNLQTTYLDALVLHSPMETMDETMTVWKTMESFVDDGKVRRLGISNCYDFHKFQHLYDQARIKPSVLQNRFYEQSHFDTELRHFCKQHDIWYQSFWTLTANRRALGRPRVKELADEKKLTPQTLLYAFLMQLGYITPLSGTTNQHHMAQDVAVMERLIAGERVFTDAELQEIGEILGMSSL